MRSHESAKPSFTVSTDGINIRAKLRSKEDADWLMNHLSAARDALWPAVRSFDVILAQTGVMKINVIKEIRSITNLGLKEAKDISEAHRPFVLREVPERRATLAASLLRAQGAVVDVVECAR